MLKLSFKLNSWEQWRIKFDCVLDLRVDLPSVEWSRLVSLPLSPLSLKQYHVALSMVVKGYGFARLKGR